MPVTRSTPSNPGSPTEGARLSLTETPASPRGPPLHQVLVKEHTRRYLTDLFGAVADEALELWLAPGNSEMAVAQDEVTLRRRGSGGRDGA